jgi:protein-disulfide isomerase
MSGMRVVLSAYQQVLQEPDLKGRVRFVYRNFPLAQLHPNATLAAHVAQAAALQGKFWEMHDKLFEGQGKWSGMSNTGARAQFVTYARELGLDTARLERDIDSSTVSDKVNADQQSGLASGVEGTPTFFINDIRMPSPQSYQQFKQYILNGVTPTPTP